jgi:ATP-binding cassette subfamily B multidrug efflux pump
MFVTGLAVALIDTSIPVFIGRLVALMETPDRLAAFRHALPALVGMALLVVDRPAARAPRRQPRPQQRRRSPASPA